MAQLQLRLLEQLVWKVIQEEKYRDVLVIFRSLAALSQNTHFGESQLARLQR